MLRTPLIALTAVLLFLAGCGGGDGDGAATPDVPAAAVDDSSVAEPVDAGGDGGGEADGAADPADSDDVDDEFPDLSLVVDGRADGDGFDPEFTCDGSGVSPSVTIGGVPSDAAELAIALVDVHADYVHWVVSGLSPTTTTIDSGAQLDSVTYARTDGGVVGWEGPCPPEEDDSHSYVFTLYVLDQPVELAADLEGKAAIELISAAAAHTTSFELLYPSPAG